MTAAMMVSTRTNGHPTNYGWTSRLLWMALLLLLLLLLSLWCFKKNLNAAKPPEQSKGLRGNIGPKFCPAINTGDFDGNLQSIHTSPCRHLTVASCGSGWCNEASLEYPSDRQGYNWLPTKLFTEKI